MSKAVGKPLGRISFAAYVDGRRICVRLVGSEVGGFSCEDGAAYGLTDSHGKDGKHGKMRLVLNTSLLFVLIRVM
jgi:hypothetical protein